MKEIKVTSNKEVGNVRNIIDLTLGRMDVAGYELIDIDTSIENVAELKIDSFDEYMKLLNRARAKFVFCHKHSGFKFNDTKKMNETLSNKFKQIYEELDKEYSDRYIDMHATIGGIVTVIRLCFINIDSHDEVMKKYQEKGW